MVAFDPLSSAPRALRQPLPYHLALLQVSPHSVGPAAMDPPLDTLLSRLTACATFYFFLAVLVVDYLVKGNANDKTLSPCPSPSPFSRGLSRANVA